MGSPLVGVWELVSDTHQGRLIVTETHSMHLFTAKDRELFSNKNEPTEAEELAAFRTMEAGAGTYSVSGAQGSHTLEFSRIPNLVGETYSWEFTIDGDRMISTDTPSGEKMVFRKVS